MTKRRLFLAVLLGLVLALCFSFAVACGGDEEENGDNPGGTTSTAKIEWDVREHIREVKVGDSTNLPATCNVGDTVTFQVTPEEGYTESVKVNGRVNLTKKDGGYSYQVKSNVSFTISATRNITGVQVTKNPDRLTYYAGETLEKTGMVVSIIYETGAPETTEGYTVNYQTDAGAFALGDTSFTVSYGGFTSDPVNLNEAVVGRVQIDPQGGVIDAAYKTGLESNSQIKNVKTDEETGILSFTFEEAITEAIALPAQNQITHEDSENFTFKNWNDGTQSVNNIPAGLSVSAKYNANWDAKLLDLNKIYFELSEEKVPQLIVEGTYRAADSAYLYLYEGNDEVELVGPTISKAADSNDFKLTFDMREVIDAGYRGKWMDIKFVAERKGIKYIQEINLDDYTEVSDFCDLDNSVHTGGYTYFFKVHEGKYLKAVADYFLDVDIEIGGSVKDGKLVLTVSGTVKDEEFRGKTLNIDWWTGSSVGGYSPIAADGKFSIDFELDNWPLNTNCYAHIYVIESESNATKLFPKNASGEFNLPIEWVTTERSDNGHYGEINGDSIVVRTDDYSRVFYVGQGTNGGLIAYGRNEKSSIELPDYDVALKVDNVANPTKVYYVVRVKLGGRIPYTKQELVDRLIFGNVDAETFVRRLESADMVKDVEGSEGVYDLWYDITEYSGGQLWPNLYLVADAEAEPTKADRIFEIKDADHSADGLFAIVDGKKYAIHSADGQPYWGAPCVVPETPAEGETNPDYVDPDYVPVVYGLTIDYTQCSLEIVDGKPVLTVKGSVQGYTSADHITFDVQVEDVWNYIIPATQSATIDASGNFTLTVDLSDVPSNTARYLMHLQVNAKITNGAYDESNPKANATYNGKGEKVDVELPGEALTLLGKADGDTLFTKTVGDKVYTVVVYGKWNRHMVALTVADVIGEDDPIWEMTGADIEATTEKVYFIISGTYANYEDAELQGLLEKIYFDLQSNGYNGGQWTEHTFDRTVTVENGTWSIKFDVTALEIPADGLPYIGHWLANPNCNKEDDKTDNDNSGLDLKLPAEQAQDRKYVDLGDKRYSIINKVTGDATVAYGNVGLRVSQAGVEVKEIENKSADLVEENGKVYLVYKGVAYGYTEDELRALSWLGDMQENPNAGGHATGADGSWAVVSLTGTLTVGTDAKTWEYKCDVTDVAANHYTVHLSPEGKENTDFVKPGVDSSVEKTVGNKTYKLVTYAAPDSSGKFYWNCYGLEITDNAAPTLAINSVTLEKDADNTKAFYVVTITVTGYTKEQLQTALKYGDKNDAVYVGVDHIDDGENGALKVYFDITAAPGNGAWIWSHLYVNGASQDIKTGGSAEGTTVTVGGKTYTIHNSDVDSAWKNESDGNNSWGMDIVVVTGS